MIDSRVASRPSVRKRNVGMTAVLMTISVLCSGCGYNTMVSLKEQIDSAWAQVENQLQRRNDLIPNLVEVTKGYAAHEKEIFTRVAEARSRLIGAGSRAEKIDAADNLSGALSRLLAIAENYPQLKADAQFARLSDELAGTENRIATERRRYNDTVREYNTFIKKFPQTLVARITGFETEKYFEAAKGAEEVPKVNFQ
jgi:LemA protein